MNITKNELQKLGCCKIGIQFWIKNCKGKDIDDQLKIALNHRLSYFSWSVKKLSNDYQKYNLYLAELALPYFEKDFPRDMRPRACIENAKNGIYNKSVISDCYNSIRDYCNHCNDLGIGYSASYGEISFAYNSKTENKIKNRAFKYGMKLIKSQEK